VYPDGRKEIILAGAELRLQLADRLPVRDPVEAAERPRLEATRATQLGEEPGEPRSDGQREVGDQTWRNITAIRYVDGEGHDHERRAESTRRTLKELPCGRDGYRGFCRPVASIICSQPVKFQNRKPTRRQYMTLSAFK
jgi:hypothetical protein